MRIPIDSLSLILTRECNLRCAYCYQSRSSSREMDWDVVRQALDWALGLPSPRVRIAFTGGEPLLALPLIRRALAYVRERSPRECPFQYVLQTNGLLLDDEVADLLERHRFELRLSFDGRSAAQDLRSPGSFRSLDSLLDHLRWRHRRFYDQSLIVGLTLVPETIPRLADSVGYFFDQEVPRIALAPVLTTRDSWRPERLAELESQFEQILRLSLTYFRKCGEIPLLFLRGRQSGTQPHDPLGAMCGVLQGRTAVVDVDGGVHGCVMLNASHLASIPSWLGEELRRLRIGHLGDPELSEAFERFPVNGRQSAVLTGKEARYSSLGACRACPALAGCVVCPISIGLQAGNTDPNRVPDFSCAFTRLAWKTTQHFQAEITPETSRARPGSGGRGIDPLERLSDQPGLREAMERVRGFAAQPWHAP